MNNLTIGNQDSVTIVSAAVIKKEGKVLICRRPEGSKLAGIWEFPGGKVEQNENAVEALARELKEELGIRAAVGEEISIVRHRYDYGVVELHFFMADIIDGVPEAHYHEEIRWVETGILSSFIFPPANENLINILTGHADK